MRYELKPMSIGAIFDRSLRILLEHFGLLLAISLTVSVPIAVLNLWLASAMGSANPAEVGTAVILLNMGVATLLQALVQGALIKAVSDLYVGDPVSYGASFATAASRFFPILLASILFAVATTAGMAACVFPYFILFAALFAMIPIVVLERKGPIEAMQRSWYLTSNTRRRIFAAVFFATLVATMASSLVAGIAPLAGLDQFETNAVTQVVASILQPYAAIVTILLYYDLRVRREAFDLQVLAREIGGTSGRPRP